MNNITDSYAATAAQSCASMVCGEVKLKRMNGANAFMFPCPFCSPKKSKASKRKNNCGILMPNHDKNYLYTYNCANDRCVKPMSFHQFLKNWNPSLAHSYQQDLNDRRKDPLKKLFNDSNKTMKNNFKKEEANGRI